LVPTNVPFVGSVGRVRGGPGGVRQDVCVPGRLYVVLSAAMSVDGYIDDASPTRLILSDAVDLDRVDGVRAGVDAILVGATTVRRDDPRLLVRSAERVAQRVAAGRSPQPLRVVISGGGELDPTAQLFTTPGGSRLVYTARPERAAESVGDRATVVDCGRPIDLGRVLDDLSGRGVERLLVEGGTTVLTQFLTTGLADELQLAVAPFFVGDGNAPRFVAPGSFPHDAARRMRLAEAMPVGDLVLLRYQLGVPAVDHIG